MEPGVAAMVNVSPTADPMSRFAMRVLQPTKSRVPLVPGVPFSSQFVSNHKNIQNLRKHSKFFPYLFELNDFSVVLVTSVLIFQKITMLMFHFKKLMPKKVSNGSTDLAAGSLFLILMSSAPILGFYPRLRPGGLFYNLVALESSFCVGALMYSR